MEKKITKKQLESVAYQIGCDPAVLDAVFTVESNGSGFDSEGRPKILFEKHIFYRHLPEHKRKQAIKAGLARRQWSGKQYSDQFGYDARWRLFRAAVQLDREAAIKATSWGIGQLMGFNYKMAGFGTATNMAKAMYRDEFTQMMAVGLFIRGQHTLREAFRYADFQAIARFYNGSGQVNAYANKMYDAFHKSPYYTKQIMAPKTRGMGWPRMGSEGQIVISIQKRLNALGYTTDIDGDFGRFTEDAVILFQRHNGLAMDGVVGENTLAALKRAQPLEPNRKPLPEVIKTSKPVQASLATTAFGAIAGLSSLAGDTATPTDTSVLSSDFLQNLKTIGETAKITEQAVKPIGSLANYVQSHAVISVAAVAVALGLWAFSRSIKAFRNRNWSFS